MMDANTLRTASADEPLDDGDRSQISEHLDMTPRERLDRLLDLLAFEERAHQARVVRRLRP
jgi:hypothetical protein